MAEPTENQLINEPYERIDRLNYKTTADTHAEGMALLPSMERRHADSAAYTLARQQEELFQDVRSQRDQLFAQFLQLNNNTINQAQALSANHQDMARRTAADAQTLSNKILDKDVDDNIGSSIGAKVAQDLVPEINNAVKSATASAQTGASGAVGLTALNASTATNLSQMTAVISQAAQALQEAATAIKAMSGAK